MSRSRKKTPIYKVSTGKYGKNQANRKVRRIGKDMYAGKGNGFKKEYPQYHVIDYTFYIPKEKFRPDDKEDEMFWKRCYYRQ